MINLRKQEFDKNKLEDLYSVTNSGDQFFGLHYHVIPDGLELSMFEHTKFDFNNSHKVNSGNPTYQSIELETGDIVSLIVNFEHEGRKLSVVKKEEWLTIIYTKGIEQLY